MLKCIHYKIEELVPKEVFSALNEQQAWALFDPNALWTLDQIWEYFNAIEPVSIVVNNWLWNGSLSECGFRNKYSNTGAVYSQHRCGRAFDLHFQKKDQIFQSHPKFTPDFVRKTIILNQNLQEFQFITVLEKDTKTWVHADTRNIDRSNGIVLVNP